MAAYEFPALPPRHVKAATQRMGSIFRARTTSEIKGTSFLFLDPFSDATGSDESLPTHTSSLPVSVSAPNSPVQTKFEQAHMQRARGNFYQLPQKPHSAASVEDYLQPMSPKLRYGGRGGAGSRPRRIRERPSPITFTGIKQSMLSMTLSSDSEYSDAQSPPPSLPSTPSSLDFTESHNQMSPVPGLTPDTDTSTDTSPCSSCCDSEVPSTPSETLPDILVQEAPVPVQKGYVCPISGLRFFAGKGDSSAVKSKRVLALKHSASQSDLALGRSSTLDYTTYSTPSSPSTGSFHKDSRSSSSISSFTSDNSRTTMHSPMESLNSLPPMINIVSPDGHQELMEKTPVHPIFGRFMKGSASAGAGLKARRNIPSPLNLVGATPAVPDFLVYDGATSPMSPPATPASPSASYFTDTMSRMSVKTSFPGADGSALIEFDLVDEADMHIIPRRVLSKWAQKKTDPYDEPVDDDALKPSPAPEEAWEGHWNGGNVKDVIVKLRYLVL